MATSSITRNFVIKGVKNAEAFADALESSANAKVPSRPATVKSLTDPKKIMDLMKKAKVKKASE